LQPHDEHPHVPGPSLWPVGFAVGIVVLLVGLVISWVVVAIGAVVAALFGYLWVRDLTTGTELTHAEEVAPEPPSSTPLPTPAAPATQAAAEKYPRNKFLEISTLGLGGVIGGLVTAPALGFMILPGFLHQGQKDIDVGPISDYPQGRFVITTFTSVPSEGVVSRRTAYIRYNGPLQGQPSFTVNSNHCAHLDCTVQPNGPRRSARKEVRRRLADADGVDRRFRCPCHGGQYDQEGNRTVALSARSTATALDPHRPPVPRRCPGAARRRSRPSATIHTGTFTFPASTRRDRELALPDPASH
jgi:Rieske Fe-S protein